MKRRCFFSGQVQGVGFRWTTRRFADLRHVTGWVRNLADGRVELLAEGSQTAIDGLLNDLRQHFGSQISGVEDGEVGDADSMDTFEIRR